MADAGSRGHIVDLPQRADAHQAEGPESHLGPELEGSEIPGGGEARRATGETAEFGPMRRDVCVTPCLRLLLARAWEMPILKTLRVLLALLTESLAGCLVEDKQINLPDSWGAEEERHGRPWEPCWDVSTSSLLRAFLFPEDPLMRTIVSGRAGLQA